MSSKNACLEIVTGGSTFCCVARTRPRRPHRHSAALAGPGTVVLLSHTRRGDSGSQRKFFDWLRDAGFVVEAVERWKGTRDGFASLTLLYRAYRYGSTTLGRSYSVVK